MKRKRQRVSIKAIAAEAAVSRNTVSLALGESDRVRPETRDRVLAVAERMGYRPNLLARALVTGRSRFFGVLVPRIDYSYMPRILQAAQDVAFRNDYGLLFLSHENDASRIAGQLEYFIARRVEGLIVFPPVPPPERGVWEAIEATGTPAVFLEHSEGAPGMLLGVDEQAAGRMAVERLFREGHRRLGLVGPAADYFGELHRKGVLAAAREAGLGAPVEWRVDESIAGGARAAELCLAGAEAPTGVICFSDKLAAGFVRRMAREGVRIPEEMSVTGVDDLEIAAAVGLTTLRAPAEEMGRRAAEMLLQQSAAGSEGGRILEWKWVERESVGPAPGRRGKEN